VARQSIARQVETPRRGANRTLVLGQGRDDGGAINVVAFGSAAGPPLLLGRGDFLSFAPLPGSFFEVAAIVPQGFGASPRNRPRREMRRSDETLSLVGS
jgi:hypothetical protein